MDAKQKDGFCSSCPGSLMEWEEVRKILITSNLDFDVIKVVPPSSALLMIENESQACDCCGDQNVESDWCKALLCRRCGAVALLEREPKGFHHQEPLQHTSTVLLLVENIILLASPVDPN